jgi:hypothetical protein
MNQRTCTLASQVTFAHLEAMDFWSRVAVGEPDECWEWTRGRTSRGYGNVHVGSGITGLGVSVALYAHRVALALHQGHLLPADQVIDHLCYNQACCNPTHLQLVTQRVNVRRNRKPIRKAIPYLREDGTTSWQIRFYDYSGPKRRHLSRSFSTEAAATAFSVALKAERAA